jgi:hypothetical protein
LIISWQSKNYIILLCSKKYNNFIVSRIWRILEILGSSPPQRIETPRTEYKEIDIAYYSYKKKYNFFFQNNNKIIPKLFPINHRFQIKSEIRLNFPSDFY